MNVPFKLAITCGIIALASWLIACITASPHPLIRDPREVIASLLFIVACTVASICMIVGAWLL